MNTQQVLPDAVPAPPPPPGYTLEQKQAAAAPAPPPPGYTLEKPVSTVPPAPPPAGYAYLGPHRENPNAVPDMTKVAGAIPGTAAAMAPRPPATLPQETILQALTTGVPVSPPVSAPSPSNTVAIHPNDLNHLPPSLADVVEGTDYRKAPGEISNVAPQVRKDLGSEPGSTLVASTDAYRPQTVNVNDMSAFRSREPAVVAHEATHEWQQNLPPAEQAAIPPDNTSSLAAMYDISNADALRKQGKTLKDLPREQAAAIVQNYVEHPEMRPRLQPWVDDLENTPLSAVEPTMSEDPRRQPQTLGGEFWQRLKGLVTPEMLNTTPRPPGPPPSYALRGTKPPAVPPTPVPAGMPGGVLPGVPTPTVDMQKVPLVTPPAGFHFTPEQQYESEHPLDVAHQTRRYAKGIQELAAPTVQGVKDIHAAEPNLAAEMNAAMPAQYGPLVSSLPQAGPVNRPLAERGGTEVLQGAGQAAMLVGGPAAVVEAPIESAVGLGAGLAGQEVSEKTAKALGAGPEAQELAGTVGGLAAGAAGAIATGPTLGAIADRVRPPAPELPASRVVDIRQVQPDHAIASGESPNAPSPQVEAGQPAPRQLASGGSAASAPNPQAPPAAYGPAATHRVNPIPVYPTPEALPPRPGFTVGPDGQVAPTVAGDLPPNVDQYSVDSDVQHPVARVIGRDASGQPIIQRVPGPDLSPVPVVGGVPQRLLPLPQRLLPRGAIQLPAPQTTDVVQHPAGKVTGIDQATGLPIVDRSQPAASAVRTQPPEATLAAQEKFPRGTKSANPSEPIGATDAETGRTVLQGSANPDVNQVRATAEHPEIRNELAKTVEQVPGAQLVAAREEKDPERLEEKIEDEGQSPETARDYSALRIAVDTPQAHQQVADAIHQQFEVPEESDEFDQGSSETGFHGHTLQVRLPGSQVTHEVQIVPRESADAAEANHGLYEQAREGNQDAAAQLKTRNAADWQAFQQRNKNGPGEAQNAIRQHGTGEILQRPQEGVGGPGSGRGRMEPGEQGIEAAGTQPQEREGGARGVPPAAPGAEGAGQVAKYKLGSTQANLPPESEAAQAVQALQQSIPAADLGQPRDSGAAQAAPTVISAEERAALRAQGFSDREIDRVEETRRVARQITHQRAARQSWQKGDTFLLRTPDGQHVTGTVEYFNPSTPGGKPGGRARLSDGTRRSEIPAAARKIETIPGPVEPITGSDAEREMIAAVDHDQAGLVAKYVAEPTNNPGKVLTVATDAAKNLFPQYRADPLGMNNDTTAAADRIAKAVLKNALAVPPAPRKEFVQVMTASPGSGKTTHNIKAASAATGLKIESIVRDPERARVLLQQLLDSGRKPVVDWVYVDDFGKTVERMFRRALGDGETAAIGRVVPLDYMVDAYKAVPATLEQMQREFGDRVKFRVTDNSGGKDDPHPVSENLQPFIDETRQMSYPELWRDADAAIEQLRDEGLFDTEEGKRALKTAQTADTRNQPGPQRGRSGSGSDGSDGGGGGNPRVPREPPLSGPVLGPLDSEPASRQAGIRSSEADTAAENNAPGAGGVGVSERLWPDLAEANKRPPHLNLVHAKLRLEPGIANGMPVLNFDGYAALAKRFTPGVAWRGVYLDPKRASSWVAGLRADAPRMRAKGMRSSAEAANRLAIALDKARAPDGSLSLLRSDYDESTIREEAVHRWLGKSGALTDTLVRKLSALPLFEEVADRLRAIHYDLAPTDMVNEIVAKALAGDPAVQWTAAQQQRVAREALRSMLEEHGPLVLEGLGDVSPAVKSTLEEMRRGRYEDAQKTGRGAVATRDTAARPPTPEGIREQGDHVPGGEPGPSNGGTEQRTDSGAPPQNELTPRYQRQDEEEDLPIWYLKSERLVDEKMRGPMPGADLLKMLRNNGVKEDELKWTGLEELAQNKEKLTPEEVKTALAGNAIKIKEVAKGQTVPGENKVPTRYRSRTLPGGKNYRELLLTLSHNRSPFDRYKAEMKQKYGDDGQGSFYSRMTDEELEKLDELENNKFGGVHARAPEMFRGDHWDEPNVLAHVRFNDRTTSDSDRKKLLHLEEIQSDWHQKGRAEGYRGETRTLEDAKKFFGVSDEFWSKMSPVQRQRYLTEMQADDQQHVRQRKRDMVPDAPFKKDWQEMVFRRMVRYAAEHGYDGVSWTPGEQQAERYDLSEHVNEVRSFHRDNGNYDLSSRTHDGKLHDIATDIPTGKLAGYVGKDLAGKISAGEGTPAVEPGKWRVFSGLDLKVGGEGLKGFYDKIIPDYANKFGKQFRAKVGEAALLSRLTGHKAIEYAEQHGLTLNKFADSGEDARGGLSIKEGRDIAKEDPDLIYVGNRLRVPYLPITDEMRESVISRGVPLFQRDATTIATGSHDTGKSQRDATTIATGSHDTGKSLRDATTIATGSHDTGKSLRDAVDDLSKLPSRKMSMADRMDAAIRYLEDSVQETQGGMVRAWAAVKGAAVGAYNNWASPAPWSDYFSALGDLRKAEFRAAIEIDNYQRELKRVAPSRREREAITVYGEADDDQQLEKQAALADQLPNQSFARAFKDALNLTAEQKAVARAHRRYYDQQLDILVAAGQLPAGVRLYAMHMYARDPERLQQMLATADSTDLNPTPSAEGTNFLRHRVYPNYFAAIAGGENPATLDAGRILSAYHDAFAKTFMTRGFLRSLLYGTAEGPRYYTALPEGFSTVENKGTHYVLDSDGHPLAAAGSPTKDEAVTKALEYLNEHERSRPIAILESRSGWAIVSEDRAGIDRQPKRPRNLSDYVRIPAIQLKNFTWELTDADREILAPGYGEMSHAEQLKPEQLKLFGPEDPYFPIEKGKKLVMKGDLLIHPDYAGRVKDLVSPDLLRTRSPHQPVNVVKAGTRLVAKFGAKAKGILLYGSGFHQSQLMFQAFEHSINPFRVRTLQELSGDPDVLEGIAHGLNLLNVDPEGVLSDLWGLQAYHRYLFRNWIPRMKAQTYLNVLARDTKRYRGVMTRDELRLGAAQTVNNSFGGQDPAFYRHLHFMNNRTYKAAEHLVAFSPDFTKSRFGKDFQVFSRWGAEQRRAVIRGLVLMYATARIVNAALNHEQGFWGAHWAWQDALSIIFHSTGWGPLDGKQIGLRSEITDLLHLVEDPLEFGYNRLNPVTLRPTFEFLAGRDNFGRQETKPHFVGNYVKQLTPIGVQKLFTSSEASVADSLLSNFGLYMSNYRTPLEEKVHKLYLRNIPDTPISEEHEDQARRNVQEVMKLRKLGMEGNGSMFSAEVKDLWTQVREGKRTPREVAAIVRRAKMTELQYEVSHLRVDQALDVWQDADAAERLELLQVMEEKRENLSRSMSADETKKIRDRMSRLGIGPAAPDEFVIAF